MRSVALVTSSRADWSTCRPLARALAADAAFELRLLVTGTHLEPAFGETVREIEADGFRPSERIPCFAGTSAEGTARSVGLAADAFAASFAHARPDLLLVVGDRLELLGVAAAALPFRLPLAHVSGGDTTGGAIDDVVRHALTKLAHLHFVAMPAHAERLVAMGESPDRIVVCGDPALDDAAVPPPSDADVEQMLGLELRRPLVLVGFHPTTLGADPAQEADALLRALEGVDGTLVFTYPGADVGADDVIERIERFADARPGATVQPSLGQDRYYALLAAADVLVGNTSSGLWEAPTFRLPVVNVGERQRGRVRAANVIDVPADAEAIAAGIRHALDPAFRASLDGLVNPYGDGRAAARIVEALREVRLGPELVAKWG